MNCLSPCPCNLGHVVQAASHCVTNLKVLESLSSLAGCLMDWWVMYLKCALLSPRLMASSCPWLLLQIIHRSIHKLSASLSGTCATAVNAIYLMISAWTSLYIFRTRVVNKSTEWHFSRSSHAPLVDTDKVVNMILIHSVLLRLWHVKKHVRFLHCCA